MNLFILQAFKKFSFRIFGTALIIFLGLNISFAQTDVKIGTNPGNKQASAVLELESTTKGFLMPRMSPAQMASISNPAVGLQIYNTTDSCIYVYRGISGWYSTCGGFNAWSLFGNTGINPATNFLGTTDGQPLVLKTNATERLRIDAAGNINQTGSGAVNLTGFVTANAGATITGPVAGAGFVNINTVGANTTNIGTAISTTNINGNNLYFPALTTGSLTTDAIIGVNRATGKADTLNIASIVSNSFTANNGLTKTGSNVALGGPLVANTNIDQATFSLTLANGTTNINATGTGATNVGNATSTTTVLGATNVNSTGTSATTIGNASSAVTINGTTGVTGITSINTGASATATNIGNAASTTNINGTTLNVTSLASGALTDSLVSVNPTTGKINRLSIANVVSNSFTANNGLTKTGSNVALGGTLTANTTVDQSTNSLTFSNGTHSINATGTGATNIGNASSATTVTGVTSINTSASATATNIGNAASTTTINGTSLIVPSLPAGGLTTDALVSVNRTTGKADTLNIASIVSNSFTANNGLTKTNSNVALGGTLISPTTVTTDATNTLSIFGLPKGNAATDSIVVATLGTSILKKVSISDIGAFAVTASNGLNKTAANDVQLGGALTKATTVTTTLTNTLAIAGLQSGTLLDSLVSVDPATGNLRNLSVANVVSNSFTANNGLTKTGSNVQLGGALVQATAINQAGFDINYSGGKVAIGQTTSPNSTLQITGSMGVSYQKVTTNYALLNTDFIVLANATSGALTITLPTASAPLTGRIYTVGKTDESTNAVTFSPALQLTETTTVGSINFATKYRVVCDGSKWWIYNE